MDKLMMNKLDDMELNMVAGGGPGRIYGRPESERKGRKYVDDVEDFFKNSFNKGVKAVKKPFVKLFDKYFPIRRR